MLVTAPSLPHRPRRRPPDTASSTITPDVYAAPDVVRARLAACLARGGRVTDDRAAPRWWVATDPEGNEVCLSLVPDPVLG